MQAVEAAEQHFPGMCVYACSAARVLCICAHLHAGLCLCVRVRAGG